jgi:hypothetical protein
MLRISLFEMGKWVASELKIENSCITLIKGTFNAKGGKCLKVRRKKMIFQGRNWDFNEEI